MLTGGKLADFLGRRLIFMVGLAVFTGASLACGLAPNGGFLIGARVVQGLGGALMNPATLSIITATFAPRERGTAIGIWAGVSAMALAIGPLVGGLLTEHVNWNWIFFINVPIGIARPLRGPALHRRVARHVARAAARRARPRHLGGRPLRAHVRVHRGEQLRLDVGADPRRVRRRGGRARRVRAARAAPARCRCSTSSLFRNRTFSGANTAMLFVGLAMFGTFFYVSLYMQNVLGYSPVAGGRDASCR